VPPLKSVLRVGGAVARWWSDLTMTARVGVALLALPLAIAAFGPFFAPYPPDQISGAAYGAPTLHHPLGLDFVGRDVLSRFLWGGRTSVVIALVGTSLGYAIGILVGVVSAYRRGWVDELAGRVTDLVLAFPALILALLLLAAFGTSIELVVIAIVVTTAPGAMRISRAASLEVVDLPYVEAAKARGEAITYIARREILPNIRRPLLADFGLRLTAAILLVAALSFLGLGLKPPAADWGLMIGENRVALTIQPWPVVVPVLAIAFITIGINLTLDGYRRRSGILRSEDSAAAVRVV
jgi:peptide/nickel transport system permease protein